MQRLHGCGLVQEKSNEAFMQAFVPQESPCDVNNCA